MHWPCLRSCSLKDAFCCFFVLSVMRLLPDASHIPAQFDAFRECMRKRATIDKVVQKAMG